MYLNTEFNFLFESFQQILATQCPTIVIGKWKCFYFPMAHLQMEHKQLAGNVWFDLPKRIYIHSPEL